MPSGPRDMSWLTPKRRRTTGNLKTISNGRLSNDNTRLSSSSSGSPELERPLTVHRHTISQPVDSNAGSDGNLFYAYARKGDDLTSRYLLTFASASVANEWWLLLQIHFPDTTRSGAQLFSFQTDDLLAKAWKHPSFAHLKTKWMYISFSDTSGEGIGGAAQSIIPVQDANGNILGGSAGIADESLPEVKKEVSQEVKQGVGRLEESFGKMMEALQQNTQKAAELAARIQTPDDKSKETVTRDIDSKAPATSGSYINADALGPHFDRLNESLTSNAQHIETLTKNHQENEEKLRETMTALTSKQQNDSLDMERLSSHLDRIQGMIEESVKERKDSARELSERPPQIDFSPLTQRLEKVQDAVEQNSALLKALLEEGTNTSDAKEQATSVDLTPLTQHLERIHSALEQQSEHTKALVSFASADGEGVDSAAASQDRNMAPLGEHLEQIYNAIEEGNKHMRESQPTLDLQPLEKHFTALREHGEKNADHMQRLLDVQTATRDAVVTNGGDIDFTPLTEYLEAIRESTEANTEATRRLVDSHSEEMQRSIDMTPLREPLEGIRNATEENTSRVQSLLESHQASTTKSVESRDIDFSPLADRLDGIHSALERQAEQEQSPGIGDSKFLMNALSSHLSKIQSITEQNATHVQSLREKQSSSTTKMEKAVTSTSEQIRSLAERNKQSETRIDAQNSQLRELMSGQREMVEVMRQLAKSIVAQNKGACDHVVVPPPRKMGRKVVGFVYDAKEGMT